MLLNDIGKSPNATFRRINQHLETNYGFKISEDVSDRDLDVIMEQIEEEITGLKIKGDDAKGSSEISKRLLVLEGIRALREHGIFHMEVPMKSPDEEMVISRMIEKLVKEFKLSGNFAESVRHVMNEYRSSEYRFLPDDEIEQRVYAGALSQLRADPALSNTPAPAPAMMENAPMSREDYMARKKELQNIQMNPQSSRDPAVRKELARKSAELQQQGRAAGHVTDEDIDAFGSVGKRASATGGHAGSVPDTPQGRHAMNVLDNPSLKLQPEPEAPTPMIRDKHGRMVPDPFAAQAAARRKGIAMKEHANLVKNLRRLLETEVSQAEVMMAAKGFAQELQEMVEKIGRLQNEDLPPVTDQMRETYGMESASAFHTQIYGALQSVMDALYTAKQQVDDAVGNMATTGQVSAQTDMDMPVDGMDDGMGDDMAADDGMGDENDLDNIGAELGGDEEGDEFGGEEALGRSKKMESILQRKVMEMSKLVAKARKLREATK